jgi:SAM-dependent methyltransferase
MSQPLKHPAEPTLASSGDRYTYGEDAGMRRVFQLRTLQTCGAFLFQHLKRGTSVLDCGCGPGQLTIELAERVFPGRVVGIDAEPAAVAQAQQLAIDRGVRNVEFHQADVYALPFPDASFDVVYSHALVSHLHDPVAGLKEARRVLRHGAVVGIAENVGDARVFSPPGCAAERWWELFLRVQERNGGSSAHARNLLPLLLAAGFERVEGHGAAEVYGAREQLTLGARAMAGMLKQPAFLATVLQQGWAAESEVAQLAEDLLAWSEHPSAYFAILKCAALGFAP